LLGHNRRKSLVLECYSEDFSVLNMQNSIALAFVKQKLHQGGHNGLWEGY